MRGRKSYLGFTAAALALGVAGYAAHAQVSTTGTAGVGPFTQAQVDAGRAAYGPNCGGCHGPALQGGPNSTALAGAGFLAAWGNRSTADYFRYIQTQMPYGRENSLGVDTYAAIAAYIYAANGAAPGTQAMTAQSAVRINTIADGRIRDAVITAPQQLAQAAGRGGRGAAGPTDENGTPIAPPPAAAGRGAPPPFVGGHTVQGKVAKYTDVTDAMLKNPAPGDWLMFRRNYQGWSYSPLSQITPANVKNLQLKWSWAMNEGGASQVTPIIHDGIMFLSNTSNTIQALNAATGELIWENRIGPAPTSAYGGTRSIAIYKDKVFFASTNAIMYALDARTGAIAWQTQIAPPPKGNTGGVMVINGKVVTGMMGCDNYTTEQCFISAYNADTGKQEWKFYTAARNGTPGGDTWNGLADTFKGGVDTWIAGTYDPDLNTTYWGTAQAKPWFRASRQTFGGHALYSSSTLALNPDNGTLKWHFQHIPGETLDLDEVFERVLIDHGKQKTVMTIGKSGILWKLDRETGKFISLLPTVFQNVYSNINHKTGELTYRQDILDQKTNQWFGSCPGPEGGHNWQATSYNQPTDLMIIPLSQSCVMITGRDVELRLGSGGTANSQRFYFQPGSNRHMGKLMAVNTTTMKPVWEWTQQSPFLTAILSTRPGVAFVGDFDRVFRALDVKTGKELWRTRLGNTAQGYPVTFTVGGKQYIAVASGLGGGSPQQKPSTLLRGAVNRPATGQQLYVFGLPD
jgi:alcohol dehydrogenase (cytochrome c)